MEIVNIKEEADNLEKKVEEIEKVTDMVERRNEEARIFGPSDFVCNFKSKEIKYYKYVKMYFKDENAFRLFLKHFGVLEANEPSVYKIQELLLYLKLIDEGIIRVEKVYGKLMVKLKGGEYIYEDKNTFW